MTAVETEVAKAAIHSAPTGLVFFPPFRKQQGLVTARPYRGMYSERGGLTCEAADLGRTGLALPRGATEARCGLRRRAGRPVVLFTTDEGCRALLADWSELDDPGRDAAVRLRGRR